MKLIDKDAVLAIIEKFMYGANIEADIASTGVCFDEKVADAKYQLCKCIKDKINTLEMKEVDIEKEVIDWWNAHYSSKAYTFEGYSGHYIENSTLIEIAKHFFELGVNASNPLTWIDMMLIHKCCKDAMNRNLNAWQTAGGQQKIYEDVLKHFKALKGEKV
jgi:hypothetical protein